MSPFRERLSDSEIGPGRRKRGTPFSSYEATGVIYGVIKKFSDGKQPLPPVYRPEDSLRENYTGLRTFHSENGGKTLSPAYIIQSVILKKMNKILEDFLEEGNGGGAGVKKLITR